MGMLLTGGTGFVGRELTKQISDITITSRNRERALKRAGDKDLKVIQWNPAKEILAVPDDSNFDSVVNLMGESIAEGRWNEAKKERIRSSRIDGTRNLVDGIIKSGRLPKVFISASAIGIYGDPGENIVEEDHPNGIGYLPEICHQWEVEAMRLADHGVRVVCLRIGIVLGAQGGALEKMVPMFRWCLGGKLGSGKQWMSWIHVDDLVSMIKWAIETESISGPLNATAPNPARNKDFTKALAQTVGRPAWLAAPKFGLRLILGEFADSLFFSQRIVPAVALNNGFQFKFSDVRNAIKDIVAK